MNIVFLDAETLGNDVSLEPISSLGNYVSYPSTAPELTVERSNGAEVVITNKVWFGAQEMDSLPELKLICVAATGMNNVDLVAAAERGIAVRNAIDYSTQSVVQVTFMHILNLVGHGKEFDEYVKSGKYSESGCFTEVSMPFYELNGKKIGIIGLGNIGSKVAAIATAFGMQVAYFPTSGKAHSDLYPALDLETLLGESDIVTIHCPLNDRTKDLITGRELAKMKPEGYIVNMGRGGIINEKDLAESLDNGVIAGAAVDVFSKEPLPAGHPYLGMEHPERLILSPHIGWASREARVCLIGKIAANIKDVMGV